MTDQEDHRVDPGDERRHMPENDPLWNESYYLDFVADQGALAGYVRIGLYPNLGVTWWTTMVVGADRPLVASVAYQLPLPPGDGLGVLSDSYEIEGTVEDPLVSMSVRGSAPATILGDPAAVYRRETGAPTRLGIDLTWLTDGQPYHYLLTTRYEIPCVVSGEIILGQDRLVVDGAGQRDHSWGVRDWWAFGWCWAAARLDDGTRLHFADIRIPGHPVAFGYLQPSDGSMVSVEAVEMTEQLGPHDLPLSGSAILQPGGIEIGIHPIAFGPLLLGAPDGRISRFARAAARFVMSDGRRGTGWIEWNQPELPGREPAPAIIGR